jgi:hypothetical protein
MFFRPALLIAGAGLAVAQSLSSQCSSTLLAIAGSQQATCLDLALLAPLAVSNTSSTSIIPAVNTWLTGVCGQPACTNATLQAVVMNITSGCSSDLASLGLTTNDTSSLVTTVQVAYPTVRQIACLKDTSANSLCVTEELTVIQSATTTLSIDNVIGLITQAMSGATINIPQNVTCSNCSKAAYDIVAQSFPSVVSSEQSTFQSKCGSSFTDGQMPSNIQETATNSTSSTGGAASLSVSSLNVGIAMLVAVSSAFAVFA